MTNPSTFLEKFIMPSNKTKFYIKLHFSVCLTVCYQELKKQSVYNLPEMEQIFSLYECDVCVCVCVCVCVYIYIYVRVRVRVHVMVESD